MSHQLTRSALKEHVRGTPLAHKISTGRSEMMSRCLLVTTTTPARLSELHLPGKTSDISSPASGVTTARSRFVRVGRGSVSTCGSTSRCAASLRSRSTRQRKKRLVPVEPRGDGNASRPVVCSSSAACTAARKSTFNSHVFFYWLSRSCKVWLNPTTGFLEHESDCSIHCSEI